MLIEKRIALQRSLVQAIKTEHQTLTQILPGTSISITAVTGPGKPQPIKSLQHLLRSIVTTTAERVNTITGEIREFCEAVGREGYTGNNVVVSLVEEHGQVAPLLHLIKRVRALEARVPVLRPALDVTSMRDTKFDAPLALKALQRHLEEAERVEALYVPLMSEIRALGASLQVPLPPTMPSLEFLGGFKASLEACKAHRAEMRTLNEGLHPTDQIGGSEFGSEEVDLRKLGERVRKVKQLQDSIARETLVMTKAYEGKGGLLAKPASNSLADLQQHLEAVVDAKMRRLIQLRNDCAYWKQALQDTSPGSENEELLILEYQALRQKMRQHHLGKFTPYVRSAGQLGIEVEKLVSGSEFNDVLIAGNLSRLQDHTKEVKEQVQQCKELGKTLDALNARLWWTKLVYDFTVNEGNFKEQGERILQVTSRAHRLIHFERAVLILLSALVLGAALFLLYKFNPCTNRRAESGTCEEHAAEETEEEAWTPSTVALSKV